MSARQTADRTASTTISPWLVRGLQLTATLAVFCYLGWTVQWRELRGAASRAAPGPVLAALVLYYLALASGALRWKMLLRALGAVRPPALCSLFRLYLVGLFYNTFVPGGVGGDLVRALSVRDAFDQEGSTGSLAVVAVERAMGLGGMCLVVAAATMAFPLPGVPQLAWVGAVGVVLAGGGLVGLACLRRLAPWLPRPLQTVALRLPALRDRSPMLIAALTAVVTQVCAALAGHQLITMVAPVVPVTASLVIVPLSMAMAYLPVSIGGVGVVELALVQALRPLGVGYGEAVVAALCIRACTWAVALPGGILALHGALQVHTPQHSSEPADTHQ